MRSEALKAAFISVLLFLIFIAAWHMATLPKESAVLAGANAEYAALMGKGAEKSGGFPPPAEVGRAFVTYLSDPFYDRGPNDKGIAIQLGHSLGRVGLGFLLAVLVAVPLGFTIGMSPLLTRALDPFIQVLKPVSPLAWMPLALYTLKDSSVSGVFVIFICSIWPMLINTAFGAASVRRDWLNVARTLEVRPLRKALLVILTVLGNVVFAVKSKWPDWSRAKAAAHGARYLEMVGLGEAIHKKPAELSGGMKQRVGIARAFAIQPKMLLLLDEPFGALDALTRGTIQDELLKIVHATHQTVFMITHDVDEAILLADKILLMSNGPHAKIAEIVEITLRRERTRAGIHHDPQYYLIRNHLVDFLVNRSRTYAGIEAEVFHDAKQPPVVRPGLEGQPALVRTPPTEKPAPQLKQVINH